VAITIKNFRWKIGVAVVFGVAVLGWGIWRSGVATSLSTPSTPGQKTVCLCKCLKSPESYALKTTQWAFDFNWALLEAPSCPPTETNCYGFDFRLANPALGPQHQPNALVSGTLSDCVIAAEEVLFRFEQGLGARAKLNPETGPAVWRAWPGVVQQATAVSGQPGNLSESPTPDAEPSVTPYDPSLAILAADGGIGGTLQTCLVMDRRGELRPDLMKIDSWNQGAAPPKEAKFQPVFSGDLFFAPASGVKIHSFLPLGAGEAAEAARVLAKLGKPYGRNLAREKMSLVKVGTRTLFVYSEEWKPGPSDFIDPYLKERDRDGHGWDRYFEVVGEVLSEDRIVELRRQDGVVRVEDSEASGTFCDLLGPSAAGVRMANCEARPQGQSRPEPRFADRAMGLVSADQKIYLITVSSGWEWTAYMHHLIEKDRLISKGRICSL